MSQLTQGEDRTLTLTLRGRRIDNTVGDPIDLTGKTVSIRYKDASGASQTLACSVLDAKLGKFNAVFTDTITSSLKTGDFKFNVVVTEGSDSQIYPFENKITVKAVA